MVLCAGFGTRLRPLTDELPKPLLPFGDRSFLEHALGVLGDGVIVANVHHLAGAFAGLQVALGSRLVLVHEPELRGTAGGIAGARDRLGPPPVVVMNGDAVLDHLPADFAASAGEGLSLLILPGTLGSGTVGIGVDGSVVRLRGERFGEETASGDYLGVAALGAGALAALPARGCLVGDYALPVLRRGGRIRSSPFFGRVSLPGDDLKSYLQGNLDWLAARKQRSYVAKSAWVDPRVELDQALVSTSARVEGSAPLSRVVVLPGATCRGPLSDAIVSPGGRVIRVA